jgi:RNA polymerase sigma-70 factor, ECF subfamily
MGSFLSQRSASYRRLKPENQMVWEIGLPLPFGTTLPDNPTDAELVESCKRGDVRAFEKLYQLHAARMKSLAFHLLASRGDAEDAVQETFLKVYRAVGAFEENSALSTWIYRILINCCYDSMRKKQRLAEQPILTDIPMDNKLNQRVAIERALLKLNERHRLVFLMFEVEGLKHSEIAGVLEVPEGTSRAWLFEAKRALKQMLTEPRT